MKLKAQIAFLKTESRIDGFGFASSLPKSLMVYIIGEISKDNCYPILIPLTLLNDNKCFINTIINEAYLVNTRDTAEIDYHILGSSTINDTKNKRPIKVNESQD